MEEQISPEELLKSEDIQGCLCVKSWSFFPQLLDTYVHGNIYKCQLVPAHHAPNLKAFWRLWYDADEAPEIWESVKLEIFNQHFQPIEKGE